MNNFCIVTGTGRCGTKFLAELLSLSKAVSARHDPNPLHLAFHRYTKWYNLPIDNEGFFSMKENEIKEDLKTADISVHSSAHMAFSIEDLYSRFRCRVVVIYRSPEKVVNSYYGKGLYKEEYVIRDQTKAIGFQNIGIHPHHFFGRTVPNNAFFHEWHKLSRVGKLAWMWAAVNRQILKQIGELPKEKLFVTKIEEFDYENYLKLAAFLNISPVDERAFKNLSESKPNKLSTSDTFRVSDWSVAETNDFLSQVSEMSAILKYDLSHIIRG